jgi:hypothetical protein
MSQTNFRPPTFTKSTQNKISESIDVLGKNTLIKMKDDEWRIALADEPIDAKVDGKQIVAVRIDAGEAGSTMIGFTCLEMIDSSRDRCFGYRGRDGIVPGCGISLIDGSLECQYGTCEGVIDSNISNDAKEIVVVLTISEMGAKRMIQFIVDGTPTRPEDVSENLEGEVLRFAICLYQSQQQVTTIPIDQVQKRTRYIESLILESQQQQKNKTYIQNVVAELAEERQKNVSLAAQLQEERQKSAEKDVVIAQQQKVMEKLQVLISELEKKE